MTQPSPPSRDDPATEQKTHPVRSFLIFMFRVLLLGIGGGFAALLGVAIAHFYPASDPSEPVVSRIFRRSAQVIHRVRRSSDPVDSHPLVVPTTGVESPPSAQTTSPAIVAANLDTLTYTLPSDALFAVDQTALSPTANLVLDTITQDLQQYPGAVIRVASHTDASLNPTGGNAIESRTRSLAQAQTVERYLANTLGDQYHWVTIGYGSTRPLVPNDSPINQQRNRRIEIIVEP